jgi:hypothetical protein
MKSENVKGRSHLKIPDIDERMILKLDLKMKV